MVNKVLRVSRKYKVTSTQKEHPMYEIKFYASLLAFCFKNKIKSISPLFSFNLKRDTSRRNSNCTSVT